MRADSKALTIFFREHGIYLILALAVGAIFWAIARCINPFTVILYSPCIVNFLSPPMQWMHVLYEKPSPYDEIRFLIFLCVVTLPVYGLPGPAYSAIARAPDHHRWEDAFPDHHRLDRHRRSCVCCL